MKFPACFFLVRFFAITAVAAASPDANDPAITPIEQNVLEKLKRGEAAVFNSASAVEKPKLRARFIEGLLTGEKVHRSGIRIVGATIDGPIDLTRAEVACEVVLANCVFTDAVDFSRVSFAGAIVFIGSVFKAKTEFIGASVKGVGVFSNTVFEGGASFGSATFERTVSFDEAQFRYQNQAVYFTDLKAAGMDFRKTTFEGPVEFGNVEIGNDLIADGAQFRHPKIVNLARLKVGGGVFFGKTQFSGPVSFEDAVVTDLSLTDSPAGQARIPDVNLSRVLVHRQLLIRNVRLSDLHAPFLRVEGPATFSGLEVEHEVNLSFSQFVTVDFSGSTWPGELGKFNISGVTFQHARAAADDAVSRAALVSLVEEATYSFDMYTNLEQFFSRQGYRGAADEVFIAGKRRERSEQLHGIGWIVSWALDWLVGYGRHPWQAGIPCVLFVILGCFLFLPSRMEPQKPEYAERNYNPFWYSLGLFLPFVDLQSSDVWKPKKGRWFLRHYMRVHTLLGWILVPILLAAISGLIK